MKIVEIYNDKFIKLAIFEPKNAIAYGCGKGDKGSRARAFGPNEFPCR
jgi:hypothetical protein